MATFFIEEVILVKKNKCYIDKRIQDIFFLLLIRIKIIKTTTSSILVIVNKKVQLKLFLLPFHLRPCLGIYFFAKKSQIFKCIWD